MIGSFVTSKAGHDKQKVYVIVAEDQDFVFLCDGKIKTLDHPKKKKKKHLQPINRKVNGELLQKLLTNAKNDEGSKCKVFDEEIKYEITQYCKQV